MEEIKCSLRRVTVDTTAETYKRFRQTLAKDEGPQKDLNSLNMSNLSSESDQLANFFTNEVETWKKDLVTEYYKIFEKIQKELEESELEKNILNIEKKNLIERIAWIESEFKLLNEETWKMDKTIKHYINLVDFKDDECQKLAKEMTQLREEKSKSEQKYHLELTKIKTETDERINNLENSVKKIVSEKDAILKQKISTDHSNLSNEEFLKFQKEQINDLSLQIEMLKNEASFLRMSLDSQREENNKLIWSISDLRKNMDVLKEKFEVELNEVIINYQIKIAKNEEEFTKRDENKDNCRFSELFALDFPEEESCQSPEKDTSVKAQPIKVSMEYRPKISNEVDKKSIFEQEELEYVELPVQKNTLFELVASKFENHENKNEEFSHFQTQHTLVTSEYLVFLQENNFRKRSSNRRINSQGI